MRRRLIGGLVALLGAAALVLGIQSPASASMGSVFWDTASGSCGAVLIQSSQSGPYVYGEFVNYAAGYTCIGMLEESTDAGHHFTVVSAYHHLASGRLSTSARTNDYWAGPGHLARACFYFDVPGSHVHCTHWETLAL